MESEEHISLCKILKDDLYAFAGRLKIKTICSSTAAEPTLPCCPKMFEHVPDFYGYSKDLKSAFIGEAKTKDDILNGHTESQIRSYIKYLEPFDNKLILFRVEIEDFFRLKRLICNSVTTGRNIFCINAQRIQ